MLNLLLTLSLGIIIGWTFHSFFNELGTPNIVRNDINISMNKIVETTPPLKEETQKLSLSKPKKQNSSKQKLQNKLKRQEEFDHFYKLLNKGLFSDAMALYLEAPEKKLTLYRLKLFEYFKEVSKTNTSLAITQIDEFIELEPEHEKVAKLLVKILSSSKNYHELVTFLEEQITRSSTPAFYTYRLAKYYVDEVPNYLKAMELLKEIEFNENFGEKAKSLLDIINKKMEETKEYPYSIPLKKAGEHFTVDVSINDTPLTLLLDTGATLSMINEEKLPPSLAIIKDNISLETAGGEINSQLQEAEKLSIGEIELDKFRIVSSPFQQKNADGLLGMNFFKKFKFKIDQENEVLYLSRKEP